MLQLINEDMGTGKFFNVFVEDEAIPEAYDTNAQQRLLEVSRQLISE